MPLSTKTLAIAGATLLFGWLSLWWLIKSMMKTAENIKEEQRGDGSSRKLEKPYRQLKKLDREGY